MPFSGKATRIDRLQKMIAQRGPTPDCERIFGMPFCSPRWFAGHKAAVARSFCNPTESGFAPIVIDALFSCMFYKAEFEGKPAKSPVD